ncbi:MAG: hypothetical protein ACI93T_002146, partial [Porticoccaceae bacterium]
MNASGSESRDSGAIGMSRRPARMTASNIPDELSPVLTVLNENALAVGAKRRSICIVRNCGQIEESRHAAEGLDVIV